MTIHNATFMVRKEQENDLILWLKGMIAEMGLSEGVFPEDGKPECEGSNPRVSAMREAGGVSHEHADAASVAFQMEFPTIESARDWGNGTFNSIADAFALRYGQEGMVFTSLFEVI